MKFVKVVKFKTGFAIKSLSKKKNNFFFTYYSTRDRAVEVANKIDSTFKPIDNKVNFIWDKPEKLI